MNKIKQIIRLHMDGDASGKVLSNRKIAEMLGVYKGTVNKYINAARADPLGLDALLSMDASDLERRLCGGNAAYSDRRMAVLSGRLEHIRSELARPHVTLLQLWEEYRSEVGEADSYGYTQFCFHVGQHAKASKPSMVLGEDRVGGAEMFVDFAGDPMHYVDRETGESVPVQVFVACLPASDYGFAMAVPSQKVEDFLHAMQCSLRFFGGVPKMVVTDNLKSAVVRSDRYQPELNSIMEQFANHHGFCVVPARAWKPRDKALVEDHVRLVYRRVYAPLRDRVFFSIDELNEAISEKMRQHNQKRMQQHPYTREERFLAVDKPNLKAPNPDDFEIVCLTTLTVQGNSHVYLGRDKHYYSVPHKLIGKRLRVAYTESLVSVYDGTDKVAVHKRDRRPGKYTTQRQHMPSYFKDYTGLSPERYEERAAALSPQLAKVVCGMFSNDNGVCPEALYKSCDGLIHLCKTTERDCFDMACEIAIMYGQYKYGFIKHLVESKCAGYLYMAPDDTPAPVNDDTRGKSYFN